MKKIYIMFFVLCMSISTYAASTVFDSMDNAKEVKLQPSATVNKTTTTQSKNQSIKEQKYNNMLVDLDDAQVELRQELTSKTSLYNNALNEKKVAIANCKNLKKQLNALKKEMRNVEKSKNMINKNIQQNNTI